MSKQRRILATVVALTLAPAVAAAEPEEMDASLVEQVGLAVTIGGGVTGFVDEDARDFITAGGAWEARVAFGTRQRIAIEAAYVGSAQPMDVLGVDDQAVLLGTGVEGAVRLNALTGAIQPYLVAGAGWTRYDVSNTDTNTSDVSDQDDVLTVPLGLGVGYRYRHLLVDARALYKPVIDADLIAVAEGDNGEATLDSWSASLRGGFEF